MQDFCTDCGSTDDLTVDHSPEAWAAKAAGKTIKLSMLQVLCRSCNSRKGAAR
jgi:5-methylcytosine-specific restriction endonuclease McrA